jgi:CheY-like chemotaxis protein
MDPGHVRNDGCRIAHVATMWAIQIQLPRGSKMARVLVIDDDEEHRTLVRAMLVAVGHEVVEAKDGDEGLKLVGKHRPDLVLTDISMPGLDGHAVISAIRLQHAGVPVIAISGGSAIPKDELLEKAAKLGATEVIVKPFEFRQLAGAVARALRK